MKRAARPLLALCCCLLPLAASAGYGERPEVRHFIEQLVARHNFDRTWMAGLFQRLEPRPQVLAAIRRPAERLPWYRYRAIFLTSQRIKAGVAFLRRHAGVLARAQERYGVPAEVIVAILGVETFYGRHQGRHPVLASLATLAFDYPPRSRFFRGELEQFLLLVREEGLDPAAATGSYAGAMGLPQFIASSFRHYAVDFDQDGRRDIWNNPADAIGSIAHYLHRHGWRPGALVAVPAQLQGTAALHHATQHQALPPRQRLAELVRQGITPAEPLPGDARVTLLALAGEQQEEYWLTLHNFYVITRYNHSPLYAMAVYQLGQAIAEEADNRRGKLEP